MAKIAMIIAPVVILSVELLERFIVYFLFLLFAAVPDDTAGEAHFPAQGKERFCIRCGGFISEKAKSPEIFLAHRVDPEHEILRLYDEKGRTVEAAGEKMRSPALRPRGYFVQVRLSGDQAHMDSESAAQLKQLLAVFGTFRS